MTLKTHAQTSQHYKTIQYREKFKLKFMTDISVFACVALQGRQEGKHLQSV